MWFRSSVYTSALPNAIYCLLCPFLWSIMYAFPQGTWTPPSLDLSRGLEALPILWNESDARTLSSPLEESSTYACTPIMHESVDVAALARACSRHMCSLCTSEGRCSYNHGNICSVDTAGMAYNENGILTAPYLAEISFSRLPKFHF